MPSTRARFPRLLQIFPSHLRNLHTIRSSRSLADFLNLWRGLPFIKQSGHYKHPPTPYRLSFRRTDPRIRNWDRLRRVWGTRSLSLSLSRRQSGNVARFLISLELSPILHRDTRDEVARESASLSTGLYATVGLVSVKHVGGFPPIVRQFLLPLLVPKTAKSNAPVADLRTGYSRRGVPVCTRAAAAGAASGHHDPCADRCGRQVPNRARPATIASPTGLQRARRPTFRRESLLARARHARRGSLDHSQVLLHSSAPEDQQSLRSV